jgi:hypothetical protein
MINRELEDIFAKIYKMNTSNEDFVQEKAKEMKYHSITVRSYCPKSIKYHLP